MNKDYLSLAKSRKRTSKRIRKAIKQQLQYVRRDLKYIDQYLEEGKELSPKQEARLSVIRIEVERSFSLAKRCFGLGLIRTKLETTTRSSIALSIIAMNLDRIAAFFYAVFWYRFSRCCGRILCSVLPEGTWLQQLGLKLVSY